MEPSATVDFALASIRSGDLTSAIGRVESDDAEQVSANYTRLIKILYGQHKDVTNMAAVGKAAVRYHLRQSELARDVAATVKLKTAAKTLAYNVAANCWPGWGDEGVVIEASHIDAGLELAMLSLRLVEELGLGPQKLGNARWLVGALQLAAGRLDASLSSFGQARDASESIGEKTNVLLADGYRAIAHRQAPDRADHSARELDDVIDRLMADGSKQARGFADQLRTAARIFDDRASRRDAEIAEWPATDIVGSARG
jgi:hypothetical protein